MREMLKNIKANFEREISQNTLDAEQLRIKYLGKKGELTSVLRGMGSLSAEERPVIGQMANEVRTWIEQTLQSQMEQQKNKKIEERLKKEAIDVTIPGTAVEIGHRHPLAKVEEELREIFVGMGFDIAEGPEVEYDYYNFQALNIPENHPARDTQDTFYITDNILLRSQTSPVQVRSMVKQTPPIRVISPGRVYRSDAVDATTTVYFIAPAFFRVITTCDTVDAF